MPCRRHISPSCCLLFHIWLNPTVRFSLGSSPGVAAPVAVIIYRRQMTIVSCITNSQKGLCGLRVHEVTHLLLSQWFQVSVESIYWWCIDYFLRQTAAAVDNTQREEAQSCIGVTMTLNKLLGVSTCAAVSSNLEVCWHWNVSKSVHQFIYLSGVCPVWIGRIRSDTFHGFVCSVDSG